MKAIIYCRVSSMKQSKDGESLENQEAVCREFCKRQNFELYGVFREVISGNTRDRPILELAIQNAVVNEVNYFVIFDIDRFSREGSEGYFAMKKKLEDVNITLRDSKNIISADTLAVSNEMVDMTQYAWNKVSTSEYAETILATVAKEERKKILQRTISREIQLEQQGYHVRSANYGFINAKQGKYPIQIPHPVHAQAVKEMFALRKKGYTNSQIAKKINKYTTNARGNPFTSTGINEVIRKPIYAGIICSKWTNYQATRTAYPGLVSIDMWNTANAGEMQIIQEDDKYFLVKDERKILRKNMKTGENDTYLFARILRYKGYAMRGYISPKTGGIYYRESVGQKNMNVSQRDILEHIEKELPKYALPAELKTLFVSGIIERHDQLTLEYENKRKKQKRYLDEQIEQLTKDNKRITQLLIRDEILPTLAKELQKENVEKIKELAPQYIPEKELMLHSQAVELFEIFTSPLHIWKNGTVQQRKLLMDLFWDELIIDWDENNQKKLTIRDNELFGMIKAINTLCSAENWHPH